MKISRTTRAFCTAMLLLAGSSLPGNSATLLVDWLELAPTNALLDDAGNTAATVAIGIDSGALFPGNPQAVTRAAASWQEPVPYTDSLTGDTTLRGFSTRVAPLNGSARYTIDFIVTAPADLILSIGQLFRDSQSATGAVEVTPILGGGGASGAVSYLGAFSWNDGVKAFENDLIWNNDTGILESAASGTGESKEAFFSLKADGVNVTGFRVTVGNGYALAAGDSIDFALGVAIPEPSVPALLALGMLAALRRGHRKDTPQLP